MTFCQLIYFYAYAAIGGEAETVDAGVDSAAGWGQPDTTGANQIGEAGAGTGAYPAQG